MVCQKALTPASLRREEPLAGNKPAGVGGGGWVEGELFCPSGKQLTERNGDDHCAQAQRFPITHDRYIYAQWVTVPFGVLQPPTQRTSLRAHFMEPKTQ